MSGIKNCATLNKLMPAGPFQGEPLANHKRTVTEVNDLSELQTKDAVFAFNNFRKDSQWLRFELPKSAELTLEFIQQFNWDNTNVHVMVRCRSSEPIPLYPTEGDSNQPLEVDDFILSITPHEALGTKVSGRQDNIHSIAFRCFPTTKVLKAARKSGQHHFFSYTLKIGHENSVKILKQFVQKGKEVAGKELFSYIDNNCCTLLWDIIMSALGNPKDKEELLILARRGRNSLKIASRLGIPVEPSTFFKDRDQLRKETLGAFIRRLETPVQGPEPFPRNKEFGVSPKRNPFLKLLYNERLIDDGWQPFFMGDKLLVAQTIAHFLPDTGKEFHPKSLGVIETLSKHNLIDPKTGELNASTVELKNALEHEFPKGFVVKKTMDYGSNQDNFFSDEDFWQDITGKDPKTYNPGHFRHPFVGAKFGRPAVVTGEYYFFMAKIPGTRLLSGKAEGTGKREYRVHSLFDQVVDQSIQSRWDEFTLERDSARCIAFVQSFLNQMPKRFSWRQGLSFDVFAQNETTMHFIEMNTNRGRSRFWSDFMRDPEVLSAYAKSVEKQFGWEFTGLSGRLLKEGLANLRNHAVSDLLYFDEKISNETFNESFILDTITGKNLQALRNLESFYDKVDPLSANYLNDVKEFAKQYEEKVGGLEEVNGKQWSKVQYWARQIDSPQPLPTRVYSLEANG